MSSRPRPVLAVVDRVTADLLAWGRAHPELRLYAVQGASGQAALEESPFRPLLWDEDYGRRKRLYTEAWAFSDEWAAKWDALDGERASALRGVEAGAVRRMDDVVALEWLYLWGAYLALAIERDQPSTVACAQDLPPDVRSLFGAIARSRGCEFRGRLDAWGQRARVRDVLGARYRKRARDFGRALRLAALLPAWRLRRREVEEGAVLFEANSITSLWGMLPLAQRLLERGVPVGFAGFRRNALFGREDELYDVEAIGRRAEFPRGAVALNVLGHLPPHQALRLPWLVWSYRRRRRRLVRARRTLPVAGASVPVSALSTLLLRQFTFDYPFVWLGVKAWQAYVGRCPPRALYLSNWAAYRPRVLQSARGAGPMHGVQVALFDTDARHRDVQLDSVFVWGEGFRAQLERAYGMAAPVVVAGSHLHEPRTRGPLRPIGGRTALLFTSQPEDVDGPTLDEKVRVLRWLSAALRRLPGVPLVVRPHPREDRAALEAVVRAACGPEATLSVAKTVAEDFERARVLVSLYSATLFEAHLASVPVVAVDCGPRTDLAHLEEALGPCFATDARSLEDALVRLFQDDDHHARTTQAQDRHFSSFRAERSTSEAVDRMLAPVLS